MSERSDPTRRESLQLATAGAVAAVLGSVALPEEAQAASDYLKVKEGKLVKLTLKLRRIDSKDKAVVLKIDLPNVTQKLQLAGSYEIAVQADRLIGEKGVNEKPLPLAERNLKVEKA